MKGQIKQQMQIKIFWKKNAMLNRTKEIMENQIQYRDPQVRIENLHRVRKLEL
jgi:hypothetical protein